MCYFRYFCGILMRVSNISFILFQINRKWKWATSVIHISAIAIAMRGVTPYHRDQMHRYPRLPPRTCMPGQFIGKSTQPYINQYNPFALRKSSKNARSHLQQRSCNLSLRNEITISALMFSAAFSVAENVHKTNESRKQRENLTTSICNTDESLRKLVHKRITA